MSNAALAPTTVPKDGPKGFGARLRILRTHGNLTQVELGKSLRTCERTIAKWETGDFYPNFWSLIEIAKYFNADIAWLTGMEYGTTTGGSRHD